MPPDTVFIIDDDAAVRGGLRFLLSAAGYATKAFESAEQFLQAYDAHAGGCAVVDVQMPSMNGLELQQELNRRGWPIPVIFATGHGTIRLAIEAIRNGAFEFLEKPLEEDLLLDSVRRALLAPDSSGQDLKAQLRRRTQALTPREREILEAVATGDTSKAIARKLGISFRTVDVHRANIVQKLGARGPADLVRFATIIRAADSM